MEIPWMSSDVDVVYLGKSFEVLCLTRTIKGKMNSIKLVNQFYSAIGTRPIK
jgi:hypothetical protein